MSTFNLNKEIEKAKFTVAKRNISPNLRASVVMNIDVSGSAQGLFTSGKIQQAFERILPIGITFDDNQEIDVFTFSSGDKIAHVEPNATAENYSNYIKENILNNSKVPKWGGTDYAPVIAENLKSFGYYKKENIGFLGLGKREILQAQGANGYPTIVYFFTDGENYDQEQTTALLQELENAKTQVYFLFIGIGNADFSYIDYLGDKFNNVGFWNVSTLDKLNDENVYDELLPEELAQWLRTK